MQVNASYLLQCLTSLLALAVGWTARGVAAREHGNAFHRAGWQVTGVAFLVFGIDSAIGNVFQELALAGGAGSAAWTRNLRWGPVLNHSRTLLMMGVTVALMLLALRRENPGRAYLRLSSALLGVGLVLGALLGVLEGPFTASGHVFDVVVLDEAELLLLMAMLFALLRSNRADRMLWALYSAYACSVALGIFWLSLLTRESWWHPPVWTTYAVRDVFYVLMAASAVWRLRSARRGREVQGMLGPPTLRSALR
jgi:hypothetical protein